MSRRHRTPKEALVYFDFEESTAVVKSKKLHGDVVIDNIVDIVCDGKKLKCHILGLSDDPAELIALDEQFWKNGGLEFVDQTIGTLLDNTAVYPRSDCKCNQLEDIVARQQKFCEELIERQETMYMEMIARQEKLWEGMLSRQQLLEEKVEQLLARSTTQSAAPQPPAPKPVSSLLLAPTPKLYRMQVAL
ncbi:uncharacterized protein LOC117115443 [Anneissia japonica]|uniref:uncharacterized protein LOC117115443 n=1 Tax=Anneissia japonica TaxID=1529436 RepID=UPI00142554FE|nr:uncharacterized protein LOC117115443 [Anneissia japonica]